MQVSGLVKHETVRFDSQWFYPGVAKLGIALGSGPRGRGFKSRHSDQNPSKSFDFDGFFFIFDWHFALKVVFLLSLFRPFPLLTTAPPQTGKTALPAFVRKCGFYLLLCGTPLLCPSGLFGGDLRFGLGNQLRQALLAGNPGHGRRYCRAASPRPATPASTALPTGGH